MDTMQKLTREQARKDLREYDNPKYGKNKNYQNVNYLLYLLYTYGMNEPALREWANGAKKRARGYRRE